MEGGATMTDKLKNCPFCGGEAYMNSYDRLIQIGCETCGYNRGFHGIIQSQIDTGVPIRYEGGKISTYEWYDKDAEEKAIAAWNNRKPMDRIVERLEEGRKLNIELWESSSWMPDKTMYGNLAKGYEEAIAIVKGVQNE